MSFEFEKRIDDDDERMCARLFPFLKGNAEKLIAI